MTSPRDCVEAALGYAARGWVVTPVVGKAPVMKDWPNLRLGEDSIRDSFGPEHNVGVVLGPSGLADIDFDEPVAIEAYRALNPPELAETTEFEHAGRPHMIVQADGVETRRFKRADGSVLLELRGVGAQTVFPPSVHPDGEPYVWVRDTEPCRVEANRLRQLASMIATVAYASEFWVEGSRHDIGLALAGFLARRLTADDVLAVVQTVAAVAVDAEFADRMEAVVSTVRRVNDGEQVTGLPTLDTIVPDLARALASWWGPAAEGRQQVDREERRQSQADVLVDIGKAGELFHDSMGTAFAAWQIGEHREVWPVRSTRFKNWLRREHHRRFEKAPTSDAVNAACGVLEGIALFDGDERRLHNRVAWLEDAIYYDLGDRSWRAVRVDQDGWAVIDRPPLLFRRYAHQMAQVEPLAGGDLRCVLDFLNVREEDELLLMVWLVTAFVPDIPHPVPDFHGEKGAGKSVGQRVLRRLIDPSTIESLSFPGDVRELVQQLSHHYAPVYDNVDSLPPSVSDILCRAVTGEGFSKRELYSDDEDIIYSYRRVIMLNGVNVAPRRPDLLDRSMLIGLERIPRHKRREEREFWEQFERAQPQALGGIFDALSAAMRIYPKLQIRQLERMADFTGWGAAVAEALGYGAEAFLRAYSSNVGVQARESVESHIVGATLLSLMDGLSDWSGSPTDLLEALADAGEAARLFGRSSRGKVDAKGWPGAPHILSRRMNEIRSNLSDLGIEICESRGDERTITIRRTARDRESSDGSVSSVGISSAKPYSADATVATDAIFGPAEFKRWEQGEPCYACGRVAWRQRPDGGWVCDVCHPGTPLMVARGRDGGQP